MKAAFYTLGCKVNQYETQAMSEQFRSHGFEIVNFSDSADVYVVNSCTVTAIADKKSRQMVRRAKKQSPDSIVALVGCYSENNVNIKNEIKEIDIILGISNRSHLIDLVLNKINPAEMDSEIHFSEDGSVFEPLKISEFDNHTRAFVKIEDGCSNFCSYCIIPYVRGPVRSRPMGEITAEFDRLSKNHYREIILTGIHLASYGKDSDQSIRLIDVIREAGKFPFARIRLGSLEPLIITPEFIQALSEIKAFCPHFHLSLQSGSDTVLRRMNRKYTPRQYKNAAKLIRNVYPDAAITTDIIVGFPGESESEFEESLAFAKEIGFSNIHVFSYSVRTGTVAAKMPGQVPDSIKKQRSEKLQSLADEMRLQFYERLRDKTVPVLIEQEIKDGMFEGFTGNYIPVRVQSDQKIQNSILNVKVSEVTESYCFGNIILQ